MGAWDQNGKPIKNRLVYSPLSDRVFWLNGKGEKQDVTQDFFQVLEHWASKDDLGTYKRTVECSTSITEVTVTKRKPATSGTGEQK